MSKEDKAMKHVKITIGEKIGNEVKVKVGEGRGTSNFTVTVCTSESSKTIQEFNNKKTA